MHQRDPLLQASSRSTRPVLFCRPRPSSLSRLLQTAIQLQARRDSNPQPPVLETGALPIELRTYAPQPPHGRGRNRTADTAIFSRVLYHLSYPAAPLASRRRPRKTRAAVPRGREEVKAPDARYSDLPPALAGQDDHASASVARSASLPARLALKCARTRGSGRRTCIVSSRPCGPRLAPGRRSSGGGS